MFPNLSGGITEENLPTCVESLCMACEEKVFDIKRCIVILFIYHKVPGIYAFGRNLVPNIMDFSYKDRTCRRNNSCCAFGSSNN